LKKLSFRSGKKLSFYLVNVNTMTFANPERLPFSFGELDDDSVGASPKRSIGMCSIGMSKKRLIPRQRGRINVRGKNSPSRTAYLFFFLCDLPWYKLFLIMATCYLIFNLIFAGLFYSIGGGMSYWEREEVLSF